MTNAIMDEPVDLMVLHIMSFVVVVLHLLIALVQAIKKFRKVRHPRVLLIKPRTKKAAAREVSFLKEQFKADLKNTEDILEEVVIAVANLDGEIETNGMTAEEIVEANHALNSIEMV
uniref:Matrix protein 2 n=1 Tax=Salamander influenza-like virus TaxID=2777034 RepID=A0A866VUB5_9ORTO|nr:matrix protein 2 [Salamander influenza-like virus]